MSNQTGAGRSFIGRNTVDETRSDNVMGRAVEAAAKAVHDANAAKNGDDAKCWDKPGHRGVWIAKARPYVAAALPVLLADLAARIEATTDFHVGDLADIGAVRARAQVATQMQAARLIREFASEVSRG